MKILFIICLFPFVLNSQSNELDVTFVYPSINTDSLIKIDSEIIAVPKKTVDSIIILYPISFQENGVVDFIKGRILDTIQLNKSYQFSFDLFVDTTISAIALQNIAVNFYSENDFNIKNESFTLLDYIYYYQYINSNPKNIENISIPNYGKWNNVSFNVQSDKIGEYFTIGMSKLNSKEINKVIKILSYNSSENIKNQVEALKKLKHNEIRFFSAKITDNIDYIIPGFKIKNIRIIEN